MLLLLFSRYYSFANEYFVVITVLIVVFVSARMCIQTSGFNMLVAYIAFLYWFEIFTGAQQIINSYRHHIIPASGITGTFKNSGIYSCFMVIGLPIQYHFIVNKGVITAKNINDKLLNNNKRVELFKKALLKLIAHAPVCIFLYEFIFCIALVCITNARTALLALIVLIMLFMLKKYHDFITQYFLKISLKRKAYLVFIGVCSIIGGGFYIFYIKEMSSYGRLLMWKITCLNIPDRFWLGTGLGRFTWYYPQWQSSYFSTRVNAPTVELLSAGESYIIFNEYLQILAETGFIGTVVFILIVVKLFSGKSIRQQSLVTTLRFTALSILVCSVTSYPLHLNSILFLFLLCFVLIEKLTDRKCWLNRPIGSINRPMILFILSTTVTLSCLTLYFGVHKLSIVSKIKLYNENPNISATERKSYYLNNYNVLENDGKLLAQLGILDGQLGNCNSESIAFLEDAKLYHLTRETVEQCVKLYWKENHYYQAIDGYKWLNYYIPNNFTTKEALLKLYIEIGDTSNINKTAKAILSLPIKIPSRRVTEIQSRAKSALSKIK